MCLKTKALSGLLSEIARAHEPTVLSCSFAAEDLLLLDLIEQLGLPIGAFTLDTGRLHQETYHLVQLVRGRYRTPIVAYTPRHDELQAYLSANGPNGFYGSVELRKECCRIRKVEPLSRALKGKRAWITGQRREQSPTRSELQIREQDLVHGISKFNPLAEWTTKEVWLQIRERQIPYNVLHDRGYPSIGCEPCTRPVADGEDIRAGRWWWESAESRECGLHTRRPGE